MSLRSTPARRTTRLALLAALAASPLVGAVALAQDAAQPATPAEPKKKIEVVDFRKIKEVLPATFAGLKRKEAKGEKQAMGDFAMSTAEGSYSDGKEENEATASFRVIDLGENNPMAAGMAQFSQQTEIDRESDNGWQRSVKVKNAPGLMEWDKEGKHGNLQIYVGNRFIVQIDTNNVAEDAFKKIVDEIPVDAIAGLK